MPAPSTLITRSSYNYNNNNQNNMNTTRTGRAHQAYLLESLPLYDPTSLEVKQYNHNMHCIAGQQGWAPLRYCIPQPEWWHNHATAIRQKLYNNGQRPSLKQLQNIATGHMDDGNNWDYYDGLYYIPNSLPTMPHAYDHHYTLLYSALTIELVKYGLQQSLYDAPDVIELAKSCCDALVSPFYQEEHPHFAWEYMFANTAIVSAEKAIHIFVSNLPCDIEQIKQINKKIEEECHAEKLRQELAIKLKRHRQASNKLHAEYKQKEDAKKIISKWLRHHIKRRHINLRTNQHIKLRNHCRGTSNYANNIKATRLPIEQHVPSKQPITTPSINPQPVWNRGLQPLKRKRRQTNRRPRPRNRPPKHIRSFNKSSSPILNHHPPNHLNNIEQATDASPTPSPTASPRYSSVPSTDWVSHNNKVQSNDILPLCVWAAQTTAFNNKYKLGRCESTYTYTKTPERAARILQNWYRRIKLHQLVITNNASCIIQHWYRHISHRMATAKAAIHIQQWFRRNLAWWTKNCYDATDRLLFRGGSHSIWNCYLYTPMENFNKVVDQHFQVSNDYNRAKSYALSANMIATRIKFIVRNHQRLSSIEGCTLDLNRLTYAYEIARSLIFEALYIMEYKDYNLFNEINNNVASADHSVMCLYIESNEFDHTEQLVYLRENWNKAATTIQHWFRRTRN